MSTINNKIDLNMNPEELLKQGLLESYKNDYSEAITLIEQARKKFSENDKIDKIAYCLAEMALLIYKQDSNRLVKALTLLEDAKYLLENIENSNELLAKILHYEGIINYSENNFAEALKLYKQAQNLLDKNSLEYAKILDDLGVFHLRTLNYQIAGRYLNDSLEIKKNYSDTYEIASTKLLIGRYLTSIENYSRAKKFLLQVVSLNEKIENHSLCSRIYNELARICILEEDMKEAELYNTKAFNCFDKINDSSNSIEMDLSKAFLFCTKANILLYSDAEAAIVLLTHNSLNIFEEKDSLRGIAVSQQVLAKAYQELGKNHEAVELLHDTCDIYQELNLNTEAARAYFQLSQVYLAMDKESMALSSLLEALKIAKNNQLPVLNKKIEDLLYEIDIEEWSKIINKTARKEDLFSESKNLIDTLNLVSNLKVEDSPHKESFLSLLRIGRSIAKETNVNTLLKLITEETKKALNCDNGDILLLDKEKQELYFYIEDQQKEVRISTQAGIVGYVATHGELLNIKEVPDSEYYSEELDEKLGYSIKTALCIPIRNIKHEIVGVFQAVNKGNKNNFTSEDEDLLIAIGSSAGIAIENSRLFEHQKEMLKEQTRSFDSFINTLAASIDARDKITAGHSNRVTDYSLLISNELKLSETEITKIKYAALLHDFGKIGIKDSILCKQGKLTDEEYQHIKQHVFITNEILSTMYFSEELKEVPEIASSHHEKYDGSGYYRGLKGKDIPLGGRILAIADVFDAITSRRHYRNAMPFKQVLELLKESKGSHFDPELVEVFFNIKIDKLISVLPAKVDSSFKEEDIKSLACYSLNDLYSILYKKETSLSKEEKFLINSFNSYYSI